MSLRTALVAPLATVVVLLPAPVRADDVPGPPMPPGVPTAGIPAPPPPSKGPTYVITPGSKGDDLGDPVKGPVVDPATKKPKPHATKGAKTPAADPTPVAGQAPASGPDETAEPDSRWWAVGAGAFLVLVLSEAFRLRPRRS